MATKAQASKVSIVNGISSQFYPSKDAIKEVESPQNERKSL